ncbi:hypothetical protein DPMN_117380 [Dreissena polymorpha]|uniref:Uncharacterized protein n=1 Tax=Dreissena polymorpha TaxID=45954 RepID=A0A9D4KQI6_DREPO|nr:hypothetical protein DPMN_117380 [Dreissena polymorpha]
MIPQSLKSEEMALERLLNLECIGINAAEKDETAIEYLQNYQDIFISFSMASTVQKYHGNRIIHRYQATTVTRREGLKPLSSVLVKIPSSNRSTDRL